MTLNNFATGNIKLMVFVRHLLLYFCQISFFFYTMSTAAISFVKTMALQENILQLI